jgi:hypothetical protein
MDVGMIFRTQMAHVQNDVPKSKTDCACDVAELEVN